MFIMPFKKTKPLALLWLPKVSPRSEALGARLAAHHSNADRAAICDSELTSKRSGSDGQLPLLKPQHLLCLSSLLTLAPVPPAPHPHARDEQGLFRNVAGPTRVWVWSCEWKKKQVGEVVQRSEGVGMPRATKPPSPRNDQKPTDKQVNDDLRSQPGWGRKKR